MTVTAHEDLFLTRQEVATLERFKSALNDMGVQGRMATEVAGDPSYYESALRLLDVFRSDVARTDVINMHTAGVSLEALVEIARDTRIFPDDFLPSVETVEKCLKRFWESHRTSD